MVAYWHLPKVLPNEIKWLVVYVMLSRVPSLSQLQSVALTTRVRRIMEGGGLPTIWCKPSSASLATQWRKRSEKRALRERGLAGSLWHRHLGCLGSAAQPGLRVQHQRWSAADVALQHLCGRCPGVADYEAWCGKMEKKSYEDTIPAGWGVNGVLEGAHVDEA